LDTSDFHFLFYLSGFQTMFNNNHKPSLSSKDIIIDGMLAKRNLANESKSQIEL